MTRIFNFSSGPAMLPDEVIKQAQKELYNWNNLGTSIMEISHRSRFFIEVVEEAEKDLRTLLNIPMNYKILFCQGGGRGQFSSIPLNLLGDKVTADYVDSGYWSASALREAKKYCMPNVINVQKMSNGFRAVRQMKDWKLSENSAYLHYCPNETIDGIAIHEEPNFSSSTVVAADFSSTILSTPINVARYGVIYASAQKNIGPAGLTLVIIREDLLGQAHQFCPSILNYTILNDNHSMFNTPPTFALYLSGLVFKWLKKKGGVVEIEKENHKKANLLYSTIDSSDLYYNDVFRLNRSFTNVPFRLTNRSLDDLFLQEAFTFGLYALEGHRLVGGMRASIYNAMPFSGVKVLTDFMIDFELRYG